MGLEFGLVLVGGSFFSFFPFFSITSGLDSLIFFFSNALITCNIVSRFEVGFCR
jgi:hypothetical protein